MTRAVTLSPFPLKLFDVGEEARPGEVCLDNPVEGVVDACVEKRRRTELTILENL